MLADEFHSYALLPLLFGGGLILAAAVWPIASAAASFREPGHGHGALASRFSYSRWSCSSGALRSDIDGRAYPRVMPERDMDERLNIEGDPEDVIKALMGTDSDSTDDETDEDED